MCINESMNLINMMSISHFRNTINQIHTEISQLRQPSKHAPLIMVADSWSYL